MDKDTKDMVMAVVMVAIICATIIAVTYMVAVA